jgi:murein DD-endopeptidase MepM/ murein hydrolase activator NlpD
VREREAPGRDPGARPIATWRGHETRSLRPPETRAGTRARFAQDRARSAQDARGIATIRAQRGRSLPGGRSLGRVSRIALSLSLSLSLSSLLVRGAPAADAVAWQRPVDGPVLRAFALGANPYARGQHRGVDLGAPAGSPVRRACAGRVSFAGRVPRGQTVSVRCGEIVATYGQLGSIAVHRGQDVAPAATLGAVGRSDDPRDRRPHVHLGARDAATGRYIDPLTLLRGARPPVPLLPPPREVPRLARGPASPRALPPGLGPAMPRVAPLRPAPGPATPGSDAANPFEPAPTPPAPDSGRPPWTAWVGLAWVGLALPFTGFVRIRRRRRAAARVARTA